MIGSVKNPSFATELYASGLHASGNTQREVQMSLPVETILIFINVTSLNYFALLASHMMEFSANSDGHESLVGLNWRRETISSEMKYTIGLFALK